MKITKANRAIAFFLALIMFVSSIFMVSQNVSAITTADGLEYETVDGSVVITGYSGTSETLDIPTYIEGRPVTSIGNSAFYCCQVLETVTIPQGVTVIGENAFFECTNLKSVIIPEGVTNICDGAFYWCPSLESVTIPTSVTRIGFEAFLYCISLESIILPQGLTSIESNTFNSCDNLSSITIPNSVTSIAEGAFAGCTSLETAYYTGTIDQWNNIYIGEENQCLSTETKIICNDGVIDPVFPRGLEYYFADGEVTVTGYTDYMCNTTALELEIPVEIEGCPVTKIDDWAFLNLTILTSVSIPEGVTVIGVHAFSGCENLKSITIPASVTFIDGAAFFECTSINTVYYGGSEEQWNAISIDEGNDSLEKSNVIFNHLPEITLVLGDINGDGTINAMDSNLMKRIIAGTSAVEDEEAVMQAADVNNDGSLNAVDSNLLKRVIAGAYEIGF